MPQCGSQRLYSLFSGKYASTHSIGSASPSYPRAFVCSPCSVQGDSGCQVTQLFLATSITGMCPLRAVFCWSNCCTWPWAEAVCPLTTVDQQSQPAKLFLNRHQHHPQPGKDLEKSQLVVTFICTESIPCAVRTLL